jgi:ATP-dependent protease ClpP protease subunit
LAAVAAVEERRSRLYCQLLAKYTKQPFKHWWKLSTNDIDSYFTAEDALKWGIVDSLWAEKT